MLENISHLRLRLAPWIPHPVVWYAFCYITAILYQTGTIHWTGSAVVCGAIAYYVAKHYKASHFIHHHGIAMLALFCCGALRTKYILYDHAHMQSILPEKITDCSFYIYATRATNNPRYHQCLYGKIIASTHSKDDITNIPLLLYLQQDNEITIGDTITMQHAKITKPQDAQFDLFLAKEGVYATSFIQDNRISIKHATNFSLRATVAQTMKSAKKYIKSHMDPRTFSLFSLLFLGHKDCGPKQNSKLKQKFRVWGVEHYLARSGLHVSILTMAWGTLFAPIPLWFELKLLIIFCTVLIYAALTGLSISFLRAVFTFLLYKFLIALHAQVNTTHVLAVVTCLILMANPLQIFFLDFQLSFLLTAALIWICNIGRYKKPMPTIPNS